MSAAADGEIGLPALYRIRGFEGSLGEWLDGLYAQYLAIVRDARISLWGKAVRRSGVQLADGRDETFWHCITNSKGPFAERRRQLDLGRAAVIGQAWDLLERLAVGDPRACCWRQGKKIVIVPVDWSLVVVLRDCGDHFELVTMYPMRKKMARNAQQKRAAQACLSDSRRRGPAEHPTWRDGCPQVEKLKAAHLVAMGLRV
jgi:hypothetical protein